MEVLCTVDEELQVRQADWDCCRLEDPDLGVSLVGQLLIYLETAENWAGSGSEAGHSQVHPLLIFPRIPLDAQRVDNPLVTHCTQET